MSSPVVLSSLSLDGILTLTINRPKQMNSSNDELYLGLTQALEDAVKNDKVAVVVLTGAGDKAFCAGADLEAGFDCMVGPHKSKRGSYYDPVGRFMSTIIALPLPLVAAVNGLAVGVGLTVLPHCDAVYCVPHAQFFSPFSQIGVCPEFCSSALLPKIVGPTLATEMLFFGKKLNATEAKAARLVGDILPAENFLHHVYGKITPTLKYPNAHKSMRLFKQLIRNSDVIAELEKVHRQELALLDFRSVGANSDAAIGTRALQESQKSQKGNSSGGGGQKGSSKVGAKL